MRLADLALRLLGSTSGETILRSAAAASGTITLPAGVTDFSATGGTSQVVRQSAVGGAFTVGQLAASDVTGALTGNQTITITGDADGSGTTAIALTLDTVNANVGSFTNANVTVNEKGLVTAAANGAAGGGLSGMTTGQIPIAATATTVTSSANLSGDVVSTAATLATTIQANAVTTAKIINSAVTYAKIQNVAANRLLGNSTGSAAAPAEIALPLAVALGGTNATTAAAALTSLGAAPLASPVFTGNPQAPTPATADNDTSVATTAMVQAAITAKVPVPMTVPLGGTGATTLPMTVGPQVALATMLQTNGTVISPATDSLGSFGYWGNGWVVIQTAAGPAGIEFARVNGTLASPTPLLAGDGIGGFYFDGCATTGVMSAASRGGLNCFAAENWSATAQGTRFDIIVTPPGGLTLATGFSLSNGAIIGAPTGSFKGTGTLNAVQIYANNTLLTSDARLKRDIEPLPEGCLGRVAAIEPKMFRWTEPSEAARRRFDPMTEEEGEPMTLEEMAPPGFYERRNWGFTAQDIRDVLPDAVEEDAEGNLSYSPSDLTAVLWRAVQELSAKVAALEGREPTA